MPPPQVPRLPPAPPPAPIAAASPPAWRPAPDERDRVAIACAVAAAAGAFFALAFFSLGHAAIDRIEPLVADARWDYGVAALAGLLGGGAGLLAVARRWPWVLGLALPVAALAGFWGAQAAGSYATSSHCEGQSAQNVELMGAFQFFMGLLVLVGGIVALVLALRRPRHDARTGAIAGAILGPVAFGVGVAAAWHLLNLAREAAQARADWAAWQVIESQSCSYDTPGLGLLALIALVLVSVVVWRVRHD